MAEGQYIAFQIDGGRWSHLRDSSISKQSLSEKPVRWMLSDSQTWLTIGFDLAKDHIKVNYQGVDVENLEARINKDIFQNKIVYASIKNIR